MTHTLSTCLQRESDAFHLATREDVTTTVFQTLERVVLSHQSGCGKLIFQLFPYGLLCCSLIEFPHLFPPYEKLAL